MQIMSINNSTQKDGSNSTQKDGSNSTQTAGSNSTQTAGNKSIQTAGNNSTQTAGSYSTQTAGSYSTQKADYNSTQKADYNSIQTAGSYSTQKADYNSIQTAGNKSIQTADNYSTQTAGNKSIQTAGNNSTQTAGNKSIQTADYNSTQTASSYSTQTAGSNSTCISSYLTIVHAKGENIVARRVDEPEVLILNNQTIQWCPINIPGYIELKNDDKWYLGDTEHIIADGILSKVISSKNNIYKVINYGETKQSWLVKQDDYYAHGTTLKQAKDDLVFKMLEHDLSYYQELTLDTIVTFEDAIKMYRSITGACSAGTKNFINTLNKIKESYTIAEIIEITKGQYGNDTLIKFIEENK